LGSWWLSFNFFAIFLRFLEWFDTVPSVEMPDEAAPAVIFRRGAPSLSSPAAAILTRNNTQWNCHLFYMTKGGRNRWPSCDITTVAGPCPPKKIGACGGRRKKVKNRVVKKFLKKLRRNAGLLKTLEKITFWIILDAINVLKRLSSLRRVDWC
jgi:hypothetical protein